MARSMSAGPGSGADGAADCTKAPSKAVANPAVVAKAPPAQLEWRVGQSAGMPAWDMDSTSG
jgi:hypothetical protein